MPCATFLCGVTRVQRWGRVNFSPKFLDLGGNVPVPRLVGDEENGLFPLCLPDFVYLVGEERDLFGECLYARVGVFVGAA